MKIPPIHRRAPRPALPRAPRRPRSGRADIQGLRAVAVALVICDHVFGQPIGGFIGVDVFFVVSGFLITHLLLSEHGRTGRVSYLDFYRRRVRRIVPVATLVLGVTIVATFLLFTDARGQSVAGDGLWSLLFAANWHFAQTGTDYFASGGPVSPLQHYWSLSVEEQFYVVWPTLLVLTLWLVGRLAPRTRRHVVVLPVAVTVLAAASFAYSWQHSAASPVVAYFSTFDRAWELLLGALVATSVPLWRRLPSALRPVLAYAGLGAIAASTVLVSEDVAFPAPWAALPVVGAALVIVAGVGEEPRYLAVLRNPVTTYLGDLSYSLYLWHFPIVVLLLAYFPDGGVIYQLAALALTLGLSTLSYHLVEDPVRHSQWLEPRWRKAMAVGPVNHSHRLANSWIGVGAVVAAILVAASLAPQASGSEQERILSAAPVTAQPVGDEAGTGDGADGADGAGQAESVAYLQERLQQSLGLDDFPQLSPPADSLSLGRWFDDMEAYGCVAVGPDNVDDCAFGDVDADTTTVVLGDSIAVAYMPAVRGALPNGRVQQLTLQECPPFDADTDRLEGDAFPECDDFKPWALDEIDELDPDLVLISSTYTYSDGALTSGATGPDGLDEIEKGLERTLRQLSAPGRIVAILSAPPGAGDLTSCASKVGTPDDCERDIPQEWFDYADVEQQAAEAAGAYYVDTRDWFCVDDYCPGFVGTTPTYVDGEHLTLQYAKQLADPMQGALIDVVTDYRDRAEADGDRSARPSSARGDRGPRAG